jgi:transposase
LGESNPKAFSLALNEGRFMREMGVLGAGPRSGLDDDDSGAAGRPCDLVVAISPRLARITLGLGFHVRGDVARFRLRRVCNRCLCSPHCRLARFSVPRQTAEMVRQIKVARDTAVKARTAAIITLKTLIVNAPSDLCEALEPLTHRKLIDRCARLLLGPVITDATASTKHGLRALATRWLALSTEIDVHDGVLDTIPQAAVTTLREAFGIGADSAAERMIVAGDNPTRVRSEAAFAEVCGACPIPASSGVTNRHRLYRGGHRQANAAL